MRVFVYVLAMAVTTYLLRAVPFVAIRGKIKSEFVRSLLYYIPYTVLSAMTFPAVFYATGNVPAASIGTAVVLVLSYCKLPMIVVALAGSVCAFVAALWV